MKSRVKYVMSNLTMIATVSFHGIINFSRDARIEAVGNILRYRINNNII